MDPCGWPGSMKRILPLILLAMLALTGCRTQRESVTEYVYLERRDTVSEIRWRIDSIHARDSIVTLIKGDTVRIERWSDRVKIVEKTDTVFLHSTDSIASTVFIKESPASSADALPWWKSALAWIGAGALLAIFAIFFIRSFISRIKPS